MNSLAELFALDQECIARSRSEISQISREAQFDTDLVAGSESDRQEVLEVFRRTLSPITLRDVGGNRSRRASQLRTQLSAFENREASRGPMNFKRELVAALKYPQVTVARNTLRLRFLFQPLTSHNEPLLFRSFGRRLSPVGLSVREHLTSELLRFL